ncbi:YwnF family protein [Mesobacillus maritimus]|uniref:DUF5392 family protein n=1 Tax=Mesobacillus maritimus TaxID=1643336 RepID=UPI00203CEA33|nr:DUF5392 family protein [Mesobacillus maritimus]MCM3584577.1 YwnF family protein [Mesobacillus maritimus]MCM3670652.1 YwnF family protein [Mesobacillus maritimus]
MNLTMKEMPLHVKKELEKLERIISPAMKKMTKYSLWTFPLLGVSIFNLVSLIFFGALNRDTLPLVLFLAIIGAIGMALYKEIKMQRKELQKISAEFMITRIQNSEVANDYHKKMYIELIKAQSIGKMMNSFIQFLNEEENRKRMLTS